MMDHGMSGMMWGMGLFGLLGVAVLVLAIAADQILAVRPEMKSSTSNPAMTAAMLEALLVFALFTFLFHFAWEILQAPLFDRMPALSHWQATLVCLKATFGDVGIALASLAAGAVADKTRTWFANPSQRALVAYLATGVLITIAFEWYAVYWAGRWSYSELMPIIPVLRVGLSPVLQWFALPMAVMFFLRRHRHAGGIQCP